MTPLSEKTMDVGFPPTKNVDCWGFSCVLWVRMVIENACPTLDNVKNGAFRCNQNAELQKLRAYLPLMLPGVWQY